MQIRISPLIIASNPIVSRDAGALRDLTKDDEVLRNEQDLTGDAETLRGEQDLTGVAGVLRGEQGLTGDAGVLRGEQDLIWIVHPHLVTLFEKAWGMWTCWRKYATVGRF